MSIEPEHVTNENSAIDLTGSRLTLVLNIAALVLALLILVEVAIIENKHFGHVLSADPFLCFLPAIAMFVVRSEPFSCFFLLIYSLISIRLVFVVYDVLQGIDRFTKGDNPLFALVLFVMATVVCIAIYAVSTLIRVIFSAVFSKR